MAARFYLFLLLFSFLSVRSNGQMLIGNDTLVGNEWIGYGKPHYKFSIDADGIYRIPYATLQAAGLGGEAVGSDFRLYSLGVQVPVHVSTEGHFGPEDYIEFYGVKNRGEFDRHLFLNPDEDMFNPSHSLYTDNRPYYLIIDGAQPREAVTSVPNNVSGPLTSETSYRYTQTLLFTNAHQDHYHLASGGGALSYSSYMHGEGFGSPGVPNSTIEVPAKALASSGEDALLRLRMASTNYGTHRFVISWNDLSLDTVAISGLGIAEVDLTLPHALVLASNQLKITTIFAPSRHSVAWAALTYTRSMDFSGESSGYMRVGAQQEDPYFVLENFNHSNVPAIVYSVNGKYRLEAALNQDHRIHFRWPSTTGQQDMYIADPANVIRSVDALQKVTFTDMTADDTGYVIITHPDLMEPGGSSAYVQYRSSAAGGGYKARAYSILDIYDQFGYGVEKHPQAIRNFVTFMQRHWPSAKMIYIVGRGVEYNRSRYHDGIWEPFFFVPTFGRPGSDNLLAATVWDLVPRYPIGRLAAIDKQGINLYLNKVKEHDAARFTGQSLEEKKWLRNVMHITGGQTVEEQIGFKTTMNSIGNELAASRYAANIVFFEKQSTDEVGESQTKQMEHLLNEGVSIINYLGHSSTNTFEFTINDASEWNNKGRYPVFSAMGCSAGQIHGPHYSLSDKFIFVPDEGAIAFISGSGNQYASALIAWARPWYRYFGELNYGATLGESILYGLRAVGSLVNFQNLSFPQHYRYLLEQQTFHGDPALLLHPLPGPDYVVARNSVKWLPELPDTRADSIEVHFTIANIGKNLHQDVAYRISLQSPDGDVYDQYASSAPLTAFEEKVTVKIPFIEKARPGVYRLFIHLDPDNALEELPAPEAEYNNELTDNLGVLGVSMYVAANVFSAVYPPDFAIVNTAKPSLIASGSNAFLPAQDVVFQIDTSALFSSPMLTSETFHGRPATIEWQPPVDLVAGQEYFWRVSVDSIGHDQGYSWSTRSFIYLPGSPEGWNQSHFHQLTDDHLDRIVADSSRYRFAFDRKVINFRVVNRFHNHALGLIPYFFHDGIFNAKLAQRFRDKKVHGFVVAIDSTTGAYMMNTVEGLYGSTPDPLPMEGFAYDLTTPESRQNMINLIENIIPDGHYVFFYTYPHVGYEDYFPETWAADEITYGKSIFSTIENEAHTSAIRMLTDKGSVPYIILFQKGAGLIEEQIAATVDDVISVSFDSGVSFTSGSHVSGLIGPATRWGVIQQDIPARQDTTGLTQMAAWALSADLADTLWIAASITEPVTDISFVDASAYPYVQLSLYTVDSIHHTPSKIVYWRVLYDAGPELLLRPELGFSFIGDTLQQGQIFLLETAVENISPHPVDAVKISLTLNGADNDVQVVHAEIPHLDGHSSAFVRFEESTKAMQGSYLLVAHVNPERTIREMTYVNNIGILSMHVAPDKMNPVLDVTFDGIRIQDGDLVSSRPEILLRLLDENPYLKLDDTSAFEIYMGYPFEFQERRIYFAWDWVHFSGAADEGTNEAQVVLNPFLETDGIYTLRVRAGDLSGNPSGSNDYFISFEVINARTIAHLYNFPNPFHTSTCFVYSMSGDSPPESYSIRIISASGVVVREITQDEIGPLAAGRHRIAYEWDGTADNGASVPAGVYFYSLITGDATMRARTPDNSARGRLFSHGWNKLIKIR